MVGSQDDALAPDNTGGSDAPARRHGDSRAGGSLDCCCQRVGQFGSLLGADLPGGLAFTAEYDATGATLVVSDLSVSVGDAQVTEGNAGTDTASFALTLGTPRSVPESKTITGSRKSAIGGRRSRSLRS